MSDDTFTLPEGWRTIPREAVGAPGVAFVAAHETPDQGFTANVTVTVQLAGGTVALTDLAAAAVQQIEAAERDVVLRRRDVAGSDRAPSLSQEVAFVTTLAGDDVTLVQAQDVVTVPGADGGAGHVWTVTFTATQAQAATLAPDVAALVETIHAEARSRG